MYIGRQFDAASYVMQRFIMDLPMQVHLLLLYRIYP